MRPVEFDSSNVVRIKTGSFSHRCFLPSTPLLAAPSAQLSRPSYHCRPSEAQRTVLAASLSAATFTMSAMRRRALQTVSAWMPVTPSPLSPTLCCRCLSSLRTSPRPTPRSNLTPPPSRPRLTTPPSRPRLPPLLNASLVPTSPPLPRIPPSPPTPATSQPVTLRPPHFLKQFFLRVHPDLFHAPFVRVQHTALVTDDEGGGGGQRLAEPVTIVVAGVEEVREAEVDSAMMREVNEASVARLNELMQYYKQLQALGEHTPLVAALPRPPADDGHFAFYCKQSNDAFTYLAHRYTPATTNTPLIALHAIDSFLTRLLLSAGVPVPAWLVARWKADWADGRRSHRYERLKRHMPWMMDDTKRAADDRQRDMIRRDYQQVKLHSTPLSLTQRAHYYMQAMYAAGLVQVGEELTAEERLQGTRAFGAMVGKYANQLAMDEWLGSIVRIGSEEEGYGWEVGMLRLPWNMTQRRIWETCNEYVRALQAAKTKLANPAGAAEKTVEDARESPATAEDRERLLSAEWAEQEATAATVDDPEWQMTAQEVRERRKQQSEQSTAGESAADTHAVESVAASDTSAGTAQRKPSAARRIAPKLSSAEWAEQLDMQAEAWLKKRLSSSEQHVH